MQPDYRIIDEPIPSGAARAAVDPIWPLFAVMFGGVWIGWPWFVFNAFAIGSPTRRRECALAVVGLAGAMALLLFTGLLIANGFLDRQHAWRGILAVTLWKLGVSYWIFAWQTRTFELYVYFGGLVRPGLLLVVAAALLRSSFLDVVGTGFWRAVLG